MISFYNKIKNNPLLQILDKNQYPLIFLSKELQISYINETAKKFLGECINKKVEALIPEILDLLNKMKSSRMLLNTAYKLTMNLNTDQFINWFIEPIHNQDLLEGFIMLGQDTTKQRLAEEKNFALESILSNLPGNVYWMDNNCTHLGCSDNVLNMLGLTREQYVGTTYEQLGKIAGWEGQGDSFKKDDLEVIATCKPKRNVEEPPLIHKDGTTHYYLTTRVPLFDRQGKLSGVAGISTDITERKAIEKELMQAKEEAELANKATQVLAESMAHELRTPLASIGGYTYGIKKYLPALLKGYQLAEHNKLPVPKIRQNHYKSLTKILKNIESEMKHASSVVDMILFRANPSKLKNTSLKTCSIKNCINEALAYYPFKNPEETILINCNIETDFKFKGEKLFTIHIIFNLLKNALYYIEKERKGEIHIWTSIEKGYNVLHFKDTSKGISATALPKIFDLYFSETPHGTGVGLAFCKQVMQIFSGEIECRSEEGQYTEFVLKFPKLRELKPKKKTTKLRTML